LASLRSRPSVFFFWYVNCVSSSAFDISSLSRSYSWSRFYSFISAVTYGQKFQKVLLKMGKYFIIW
jgi:hypothetical protein